MSDLQSKIQPQAFSELTDEQIALLRLDTAAAPDAAAWDNPTAAATATSQSTTTSTRRRCAAPASRPSTPTFGSGIIFASVTILRVESMHSRAKSCNVVKRLS